MCRRLLVLLRAGKLRLIWREKPMARDGGRSRSVEAGLPASCGLMPLLACSEDDARKRLSTDVDRCTGGETASVNEFALLPPVSRSDCSARPARISSSTDESSVCDTDCVPEKSLLIFLTFPSNSLEHKEPMCKKHV